MIYIYVLHTGIEKPTYEKNKIKEIDIEFSAWVDCGCNCNCKKNTHTSLYELIIISITWLRITYRMNNRVKGNWMNGKK